MSAITDLCVLISKANVGTAMRILERLRQWRNEADYLNDLPWTDVKSVAATAIVEAVKIFNSLVPPTGISGT